MVQLENEYGSFGWQNGGKCDIEYMTFLKVNSAIFLSM
jgi:hypothetical protein